MTSRSLPEAQWDIIEESECYDNVRAGLGDDFVAETREAISRAVARPRLYAQVDPPVRAREVRQTLVRRFPFKVIYEVTATEVIIVAVTHVRRRDRRWRRRL
ncbi:MAG TPA: hypothetical protein VKE40_26350 [Gemmataceae bacterium]|nr:hypothetical protein [Gemmataceae bacterium]